MFLPETISPSGHLVGKLIAKWQDGAITQIDSNVSSQEVNFVIDESFIKTNIPIEKVALTVQSGPENLMLDAVMESSVLGNALTDIDISDITNTRNLVGSIELSNFDFANLHGFSQRVDKLTGLLNASIKLSGDTFSPNINGNLALTKLAVMAPFVPFTITDGNINVDFDDLSARVNGQIVDDKQGQLAVNGLLDWQKETELALNLSGQAFRVALEPNLWLSITPNMNINVADKFAQVSGSVEVVDGRIKVKQLPEGAVSVSDDEFIIDGPVKQNKSIPLNYALDLYIVIHDKVRIDSFGLRSKLKGDLLFKQEPNTPLIATGEVTLLEGRYRALGQELFIENGQLNFNGAIDKPYLNVRAVRSAELTEDGVVAGVKLTGGIDAPVLEVFSEPNMDQAMALSYVLTGRSLSDSDSATDGMLTQLLLARGLARGENKVSRIGEAIGIEDVSLSSRGSGEETKVEISGYVAPGIQVRYSIGIFDSMSEVAVRYQLLPKLYIEAISGLNDSLDILYKFDWE